MNRRAFLRTLALAPIVAPAVAPALAAAQEPLVFAWTSKPEWLAGGFKIMLCARSQFSDLVGPLDSDALDLLD